MSLMLKYFKRFRKGSRYELAVATSASLIAKLVSELIKLEPDEY